MHKIISLFLILTLGCISCKTSEKEIDTLEIAKKYYQFLDNSDASAMVTLLGDSIVIRETDDDYQEVFSKKRYGEWVKWDSVFEPTYDILEMMHENGMVKTKISKTDKRIHFLHEAPIVSFEVIHFDKNKIIRVAKTYEAFNASTFLKNRGELLNWVEEYRPELNGYLHDQTLSGGLNYLKAIELYRNKK